VVRWTGAVPAHPGRLCSELHQEQTQAIQEELYYSGLPWQQAKVVAKVFAMPPESFEWVRCFF
jgi:hypothetical protein